MARPGAWRPFRWLPGCRRARHPRGAEDLARARVQDPQRGPSPSSRARRRTAKPGTARRSRSTCTSPASRGRSTSWSARRPTSSTPSACRPIRRGRTAARPGRADHLRGPAAGPHQRGPGLVQCRLCAHHESCHGERLPERTCRSCLHVTPIEDGGWRCARCDWRLLADDQRAGCPHAPVHPRPDPGRAARRRSRWRLGRLPQGRRQRLAGRCAHDPAAPPLSARRHRRDLPILRRQTGTPSSCIPTAGGKSLVMADFIQEVLAQWPDQRIIILTHVRELISQNSPSSSASGPRLRPASTAPG